MLTRRNFVAAAAAAPLALHAAKKIPVGLELFSVRKELEKDLMGTVRAVRQMGYEVVEFFSPYFNLYTGDRVAFDNTSIGATMYWRFF